MNKIESMLEELKKDIATVMEWRKSGKQFTNEQLFFANKVADQMIGLKNMRKMGVQLVNKANIDFVNKYEAMGSGGDASATQDAVSSGPAEKDCTCGKGEGCTCNKDEVVSEGLKDITKVEIPKGDKSKALPASGEEGPASLRHTPDVQNIPLETPPNQAEGEVSSVADAGKDEVKAADPSLNNDVPSEKIGHNPELPMPKSMADDLIANAKWGVEVGAYDDIDEGISLQLGRKCYEEFVDTDEKFASVIDYLKTLMPATTPTLVAE